MKISNKILTGGFLLQAVLVLALVFAAVQKDNREDVVSRYFSSEPRKLAEFDRVSIRGAWDVIFEQSDVSEIIFTSEEKRVDNIILTQEGRTLKLDLKSGKNVTGRYSAVIRTPDLKDIRFDGSVNAHFQEADYESLDILVRGASNMESSALSVKEFKLRSEGLCNVNMTDAKLYNVYLLLEGMGDIDLNMTGGSLSGNIEGMATVNCFGDIGENNLKLSGLGTVNIR